MNNQDQLLNEIIQLKIKLRDLALQHYAQHEIFSWTWWIDVVLIIVPLILWWRIVDRNRLLNICVFGLIVNMIATFLDVTGTLYAFWEYPVYTLPHIPLMLPVDYVIVPVVGMVIYQKFAKWIVFILVCILASALMSFIGEPIAVLIRMYKLITWRYIFSFPIYIVIYIVAKFASDKFTSKITPTDR